MINVNRSDRARKVIGVILVGIGVSLLVGVLLYFSPRVLRWLSSYPAWATFLVGFAVFSLGAFLAVREHIKATKKAHKAEGDSHQEGS
jgi:predicted ferric reductase